MRTRSLTALLPALLLLGSCSDEVDPAAPRQVVFTVNAVSGTPFEAIELRAANAVHHPCLGGQPTFAAPYRFFLLNPSVPVQGVFRPTTDEPLTNVQLSFGGEVVPRRIDQPDESTPIHSSAEPLNIDTGSPPCTGAVFSGAPEVQLDVFGTPGALFDANIGHLDGSFLVGLTPVPATFYLEEANERVTGVFGKLNDVGELSVRLLIDGEEVQVTTSPAGSPRDVVVEFEF